MNVTFDGLHPSDKGFAMIANMLVPFLKNIEDHFFPLVYAILKMAPLPGKHKETITVIVQGFFIKYLEDFHEGG